MPINLALDRKNLLFTCIVTLFFSVAMPVLLPQWRLNYFAPFIIILYYKKTYQMCLWGSFLCGLVIDLLSADLRIGLHALDYCVTTAILYRHRTHFFADSLTTLPLMIFLFSVIATAVQLILINVFEHSAEVSWQWVLTDLLYLPLFDALYGFVLFILPAVVVGRSPRRGRDYFLR